MTRRSFLQVTLAALAPSGCNLSPEPPVRIGANIWPGYECLFVARSLGLFQPRPVKLVEYPSSPEVVRAFKNRTIELAAMTADEFLRLASEQSDVRAVLVMDISKGADALIGRADHSSVSDLRGKKIGVEVNALGVFFLSRALASVGLRAQDVEPVPLENDQHIEAFAEGRVDAIVSFEPHRTKMLKQGGRVLFDSSKLSGEIVDYLVTRESVLEEREPAVRVILEGWFKARERLLTEGEDIARLVMAREGVTSAEFLKSLELLELPSVEKNRQMLAAGGPAARNLWATHAIMQEYGLFHGDLPRTKLFNGSFLP